MKETPTNFRVYYKLMREEYTDLLNQAMLIKLDLINEIHLLKQYILEHNQSFIKVNIDLTTYNEFVNDTYTNGNLFRLAQGLFINRTNDYELNADYFKLYQYAEKEKYLYNINKDIVLYEKLLNLTLKEYTEILRIYYTEVHKHMILNGEGYAFSNEIGWICINRCILRNPKPIIDYKATKLKEKELKANGDRIFNKDEYEFCLRNNILYDAKDKRVFKTQEYCYEIPLLNSQLKNGTKLRLTITDYRHSKIRGKTNEDLAKECNYDLNAICELPLDLKTKLTICDNNSNTLYLKHIKNENQQSYAYTKAIGKNR